LKQSESELERLYRESSTRADRLEKINHYILKSIGSGVINVDLTGKIIGCNQAAIEILGYDQEMLMGIHYLAAFPHEMELNLLIEAGLERGEVCRRREIELKRPHFPDLWLGVESSIILDDNDRVMGVTLLITDLTEMKKLQEELETNRRLAALGEMTGGLAHQLRNSLAAISGFCQLLKKKTRDNSEIEDIAISILDEAADSEEMVSRFLSFARPLSLNRDNIDLRDVIEDCRTKIMPICESDGVNIKFDCPYQPIDINGDGLLLKEAIGNILDNAVAAAGRGGSVEIQLDYNQNFTVVEISDDGPGIAKNIRDKIFTPFVSSKPSGTGLGLALARKIINLHRGTISHLGNMPHGTICRITLPALPVRQAIDIPTVDTSKKV
jgi:PAS domain S-box-containing protein